MNINLIGVPLTYGCGKTGANLGPSALRMENIQNIAKNFNLNVFDLGDIYIPNLSIGDKYKNHDHLKYLHHIIDVNINLAEQVNLSMNSNNFPLIIGGDHSLAIGSIAGVSRYHNNLDNFAVIWIDAHSDINTPESSPTGNIHGMPLAVSLGKGHDSLTNLYSQGCKVKPKNVYIIGARDIDPGEYKLSNQLEINLYEMKDIKEKGLKEVILEVIQNINNSNIKNVHLSFDIDSLDASLVPGTGTPVKNGFSINEAKYIISTLLETKFIKSMDFVEFNPTLDPSDKTIEVCLTLINTIFKSLSK